MAKEGTFQLLGQPNPDVADINKGRIFWDTTSDTFKQIDENGIIKDLTSENPGGNNTNIQFNNLGTLGGSDNFVFDGTAVGIGTLIPDSSSILDLTTTTRGFLMPVMTTIERDAIPSPATGLEIYNITNNEPEYFSGSIWRTTGGTATTNSIMGGISTIGSNVSKTAAYGHNNAIEPPVMQSAGEVTGLSIALTTPLTGGTCEAQLSINGVAQTAVGQTVILTSGGIDQFNLIVFNVSIPNSSGDRIGLQTITTGASPTGADATLITRIGDT